MQKQETVFCKIGGLYLSVYGGGAYLQKRCKEYMLPLGQEGEHSHYDTGFCVRIHRTQEIPEVFGDRLVVDGGIWYHAENKPNTIYRGLIKFPEVPAVVLEFTEDGADITLFFPEEAEDDRRDFYALGYAMEQFALKRERVVFHSSCILCEGKAVAFSAPSGTGKSTHTALWKEHIPDVRYISDDTPMLRLDRQDRIYACGTPWSGKTEINANIEAPLAAIVFLERSDRNRIERISGVEAYARLFGETRKIPAFPTMDAASELCEKLLANVPVYCMGCNISADAAKLAYREIFGRK